MIHPKSHVLTITPYVGGDVTPPGMYRRIVLASNENPFGPSPKVLEFLQNSPINLAQYPSGNALKLREDIAQIYNLDPGHILCGNGSEDIIHLLCKAYLGSGDEAIVPQYGFLVYPIAVKSSGATLVPFTQPDLSSDVDHILSCITPHTKIVFLDNPANPLGYLMVKQDLLRLHDNLPSRVLLVLDEAYGEYVDHPDFESGLTLFKDAPNVVVLKTFSKAYGLAGLRVGWAHGSPTLFDPLHRIRQPFNVNSIGQAVALCALQDRMWLETAVTHNRTWRAWTHMQLKNLGYSVNPGHGNFLLFDAGSKEKAEALYRFLGEHGLMIRPLGGYGLFQHMRVSIGLENDMHEFIHLMASQT